ncbi:MAG: hypothetical protein MJ078_05265, partial [Clostridia bacterium]|nr:hypothetical protein [Clostridia bacterium]
MIKKLIALLIAAVMAFQAVPAFAEQEEAPALVTLPIYYHSSVVEQTLDVAFFNDVMDIPYCSAETVTQLLYNLTGHEMEYGYATYRALEDAHMLSLGTETDPDTEVF